MGRHGIEQGARHAPLAPGRPGIHVEQIGLAPRQVARIGGPHEERQGAARHRFPVDLHQPGAGAALFLRPGEIGQRRLPEGRVLIGPGKRPHLAKERHAKMHQGGNVGGQGLANHHLYLLG
ncbi:hypothetical protein D3C73_1325500 [compost metagenome]